MTERDRIEENVMRMFEINLGLKSTEKILVATDIPTMDEWTKYTGEKIDEMVKRSTFAKIVGEIASEKFNNCIVEFYPYLSVGQSGKNPGKHVEEKMRSADVVVAITTYSLSHTVARDEASKMGARIASMPNSTSEMFYEGGPMSADYRRISKETSRIADLLTEAETATVKSRVGTDITFSLKGRKGKSDDGLYTEEGKWGNLPAGEAYAAPLEETAKGVLIVEKEWYPNLEKDMILDFKQGLVSKIDGGGPIGNKFREMLFEKDGDPYISRRNLAELGVGTNPNAIRPDNPLEAEKIKGTVHIAIGNNSFIGGVVSSDLHIDFIIPQPDLILDGKKVIERGKWIF